MSEAAGAMDLIFEAGVLDLDGVVPAGPGRVRSGPAGTKVHLCSTR